MVLTGNLQLSVYITRLICKAAHVLYGIWKPRLQWHYKHTLETTDSFPFVFVFFGCCFFSSFFFYKMVQTTIQNICAVDNLQKKSFDSITVQFFFQFFFFNLLHLKLCDYGTPECLLDCSACHAGCNTF